MELKVNTTLQHYRYSITSCIGDGGFGITYLARDNKLEREVVLKEYFPDYLAKRDVTASNEVHTQNSNQENDLHIGIAKFMKEAKTLALLNDISSIATVYDFFEENNTAYIVMEYIKGKSLKQYIKERTTPYSFDEAMKILEPCMLALQKVHEAGIIHRDFAPDNILINERGQVKIIDFGSSRDYASSGATMTVMVKHGYAPIEQYSNAVKQGTYTDVYSIAAILYEMITLTKPMPSIDRVISDSLVAPSAINSSITKEQDKAVMKGLSVIFSSRYQTVDDFIEAINASKKRNRGINKHAKDERDTLNGLVNDEMQPKSATHQKYQRSGIGRRTFVLIIAAIIAVTVFVIISIVIINSTNSSSKANKREKKNEKIESEETENNALDQIGEQILEDENEKNNDAKEQGEEKKEKIEKNENDPVHIHVYKEEYDYPSASIDYTVEYDAYYDYDDYGRKSSLTVMDASGNKKQADFAYDIDGNCVKEVEPGTDWIQDDDLHVIGEIPTVFSNTCEWNDGKKVKVNGFNCETDERGNLIVRFLSDGSKIEYTYDELGRLVKEMHTWEGIENHYIGNYSCAEYYYDGDKPEPVRGEHYQDGDDWLSVYIFENTYDSSMRITKKVEYDYFNGVLSRTIIEEYEY